MSSVKEDSNAVNCAWELCMCLEKNNTPLAETDFVFTQLLKLKKIFIQNNLQQCVPGS